MARANVTLRRGTRSDRAFLERLGSRTVMDSVSASRHPDPAMVLHNFERLLQVVESRSHATFIAEIDANPAGFVLLIDDLPDEVTGDAQGFVAYMAVERANRGQGVGAALLAAAEDEARRRGLPYMALMVTEENAAARALYEGAGYVTERRLLCKTL
jgi:ribosomal protein S18 acetylase RimI-like enzyme